MNRAINNVSAINDWQELRDALGLTQQEMAMVLAISDREVRRLETGAVNEISPATELILRAVLRDPEFRRRLDAANYPHPYPGDLLI